MPAAPRELSLLIVVISCDGSGKTTVSEEVVACVRAYGPAEAAHLSKQSGNIGRAIAQLPLIGPRYGVSISRSISSC